MYNLLIKLMFIAALLELGISISGNKSCHSRQCLAQIEKGAREVLKINWRPISIFPEEARRFR